MTNHNPKQSTWDGEESPPPGIRRPRTLREARRRKRRILDDIKDMELQLANPNVTDKDGNRLDLEEWELWKSKVYRRLRKAMKEASYLRYWVTETRTVLRALDVGVKNHLDPNAHLSASLRLMRSIRKCEALPKELHKRTGEVADAVEAYLTHNAEVA